MQAEKWLFRESLMKWPSAQVWARWRENIGHMVKHRRRWLAGREAGVGRQPGPALREARGERSPAGATACARASQATAPRLRRGWKKDASGPHSPSSLRLKPGTGQRHGSPLPRFLQNSISGHKCGGKRWRTDLGRAHKSASTHAMP